MSLGVVLDVAIGLAFTYLLMAIIVSGVVELVSKSFYQLQVPGQPPEVNFGAWNSPPPNAAMLAFGNLGVAGGKLTVQGWLFDVKNIQSPQVLGKQYSDTASDAAARLMAHKFADEIIFRLGGGIQGIAETQIYFVSDRTGHKEIWAMDYDGSNQHQITHLGSIALAPRISPDGSRIAFSGLTKTGWEIMMYSLEINRMVGFPHMGGTNLSPAWSGDGTKLAFSSSKGGDPEIYVADASGANSHRLTTDKGPDVSPVWNRKTNGQISFVSGRTGLPPPSRGRGGTSASRARGSSSLKSAGRRSTANCAPIGPPEEEEDVRASRQGHDVSLAAGPLARSVVED